MPIGDDDFYVCDCGSDRRDGDHKRCWMLNAYDEDELRRMLR